MKWLLAILIAALSTLASQPVVVIVRRLAVTDLQTDSVWTDTLPRAPWIANGMYYSPKWTIPLPMQRYIVEVVDDTP